MKVIALIPARSGSKGFPHKNIAEIRGKTLIELAVKVGLDSKMVNDVYISTDSAEYQATALNAGAKSTGLRPAELSGDFAKTIDVVIDVLMKIEIKYDYVVLLQPTSPMRRPADIENMLYDLDKSDADSIVSIERLIEPHPDKLKTLGENGFIQPFLKNTDSEMPRQLLSEVYKLNGAVYIAKYESIINNRKFLTEKTLPYLMSGSINIDSEFDYNMILGLMETEKIKIYGV